MKLRHAAALSLVSWSLVIPEAGKTVPKDCANCAVTLEARAIGASGFKTKAECEKAGADYVRNFYANAEKNGQRVAVPPGKPECHEDIQK